MNPSSETPHDVAATDLPPTPARPPAVPAGKSGLPLLLAGILAGVFGTAFLLPRLNPPPHGQAPGISAEAGHGTEEAGHGYEEGGPIELSAQAARSAGIRVEAARLAPIGEGLTVSGTVEVSPTHGAKITPPAPGKVVRLLVSPGDAVRPGQPLAVLDSYEVAQAHAVVRQAEAAVQQARSGVQTARAEVDQAGAGVQQAQAEVAQTLTRQKSAETTLQRQRDLARAGAFAQAPLQAAQSELSAARAELRQAQAELQTRTAQLQRTERLFKEELVSRADLELAQLEQQQDRTAVERAEARTAFANQALEREQAVFRGGLLNAREVQTAEAEVRAAQGEVEKARQGVFRALQDARRAQKGEQAARTALRGAEEAMRAARTNLYALEGSGHAVGVGGLLTVSAPIGGVVTERGATVGEAVERTTSLLIIENLSTVTVVASVPEGQVARIRPGLPVEVTVAAYPGRRFPGTVHSVAGRVEEKTRSLPVRCLVENRAGALRPEMFAKVTLGVGARTRALVVPPSALEEDGAERYVYVEAAAGKYQRRKVEVGRTTEAASEIRAGLKPGERVVTDGVFVLKSEGKKDELRGHED